MTILATILATKKEEVAILQAQGVSRAKSLKKRPSLFTQLQQDRIQVIAEMKRASPSKGIIAEGANPVKQAQQYEKAGAACISVLTDQQYFKGSFDDLQQVAEKVDLPLLCKDFMIDEIQIEQAKQAGASVILLIVAALSDEVLQRLYTYATNQELDVLVEVHNVEELHRALAIDAKIIGVNNRDLKTFTVDLQQTEEVAAAFPFHENRILVSESGLVGKDDAVRVAQAGAQAVLIGETLMRSGNVAEAIQALQVPVNQSVIQCK